MHKGGVDQPANPPTLANRGYLASSSALFAILRYLAARCPAFNHSSLDSMHQPPRSGLDEPGSLWFDDKHVVHRIFSPKLLGTEAGRGFPSPKWPLTPMKMCKIGCPYTSKPRCGAEPLRCRFLVSEFRVGKGSRLSLGGIRTPSSFFFASEKFSNLGDLRSSECVWVDGWVGGCACVRVYLCVRRTGVRCL